MDGHTCTSEERGPGFGCGKLPLLNSEQDGLNGASKRLCKTSRSFILHGSAWRCSSKGERGAYKGPL